ncbi:MAG: hypothetical protein HY475_03010 [Candidatus Terrybacteria bacterium]|nr:hypothetical protein [Candidatus Terrybacteria bacterium]
MEHALQFIERLRQFPEPIRRQVLWVSVMLVTLVLGALWLATLSWQLKAPQEEVREQPAESGATALPGAWESVRASGAHAGAELRGFLRTLLLSENNAGSPEIPPLAPSAAPSDDTESRARLPDARQE